MNLTNSKSGTAIILILVFILSACTQPTPQKPYPLHYSDAIMGTTFTIKASSLPDSLSPEPLKRQIMDLLDAIDGQMSTYKENSELSLINKDRTKNWLTVSESLYSVLKQAREIAEISNGAFDITVGPLVNLWGFGPAEMKLKRPADDLIKEKLAITGYQHLLFDDQHRKIKKQIAELYLDLSGIAKGYAVDQVSLLLESLGIEDFMVEIGGEIRVKGQNINNVPWRIAVEKPISERRMIQKVLPLTNIAIATSGDYRNYFELNGVRFSHTIDPETGRPITHGLASVSILSETTMMADGYATAIMVMGPEKGFAWAERNHIAAYLIIKSDHGFEEKATQGYIQQLKQKI